MPLKNDVALGEAAPAPHSRDPLGIWPRGKIPKKVLKKVPKNPIVGRELDELRAVFAEFYGPRNKQIVEMRLGIGQPPHTLDQVGRHFKLTRERVRQIVHQAQRASDARFDEKERKRKRAALQTHIKMHERILPKLRKKLEAM